MANISEDKTEPALTLDYSDDKLTCESQSVTLTATGTNVDLLWSDADRSTTASISVSEAGTYSVTATDRANGCQTTLSSPAIVDNKVLLDIDFNVTPETQINLGASVTLDVTVLAGEYQTIVWQRNDDVITPDDPEQHQETPYGLVRYVVTAEGGCNTVSRELTINVERPTVFTPYDGNGKNTTFVKNLDTPIPLLVYDRFGNKIADTNDGWDGVATSYSNKMATPGVYFYVAKLPDGTTRRGTVEVYR